MSQAEATGFVVNANIQQLIFPAKTSLKAQKQLCLSTTALFCRQQRDLRFSLSSDSGPQGQVRTSGKCVLVLLQCGSVALPRAQLLLAKDKDNEIQRARSRGCGPCEIHAQVSAVAHQHVCRRHPMKQMRKR